MPLLGAIIVAALLGAAWTYGSPYLSKVPFYQNKYGQMLIVGVGIIVAVFVVKAVTKRIGVSSPA